MTLVLSLFLRAANNALSPPGVVSLDGLPKWTEDAYHFVVYLPVNDALYELDVLFEPVVRHAPVPDGPGWVVVARARRLRRISSVRLHDKWYHRMRGIETTLLRTGTYLWVCVRDPEVLAPECTDARSGGGKMAIFQASRVCNLLWTSHGIEHLNLNSRCFILSVRANAQCLLTPHAGTSGPVSSF